MAKRADKRSRDVESNHGPLPAGPAASNEPVIGEGPGKVEDGDLQMRTQGALERGDAEGFREHINPESNYRQREDPHERLRKIVERKKAREKGEQ